MDNFSLSLLRAKKQQIYLMYEDLVPSNTSEGGDTNSSRTKDNNNTKGS